MDAADQGGLTWAELAEALGIPEAAVRHEVGEALVHLGRRLRTRGVVP